MFLDFDFFLGGGFFYFIFFFSKQEVTTSGTSCYRVGMYSGMGSSCREGASNETISSLKSVAERVTDRLGCDVWHGAKAILEKAKRQNTDEWGWI